MLKRLFSHSMSIYLQLLFLRPVRLFAEVAQNFPQNRTWFQRYCEISLKNKKEKIIKKNFFIKCKINLVFIRRKTIWNEKIFNSKELVFI
ncbi:hypothetical protein BpHYR1_004343 [Brachionus plicatilis]|uniref:Secreted protein n=1 Tax=Brachionus plicatilis TaxID=10195 RepID=A0A3M7RFM2_BRAPC|nr:hypothetical protein BpHYR1_004343 [Brachionus plicatilis]